MKKEKNETMKTLSYIFTLKNFVSMRIFNTLYGVLTGAAILLILWNILKILEGMLTPYVYKNIYTIPILLLFILCNRLLFEFFTVLYKIEQKIK